MFVSDFDPVAANPFEADEIRTAQREYRADLTYISYYKILPE